MLICQEKLKTICLTATHHAAMPEVLSKFEVETLWDVAARLSAPAPETTQEEWSVIEAAYRALAASWEARINGMIARLKAAGVAVAPEFRAQLEAELASAPQVVRT